MKRLIAISIFAACVLLVFQFTALADTGKIGKEYTLDGECTFKVKSAKGYDVFFNQESGTTKQWIVVSFELLNWRDDLFYVKTETKAKVIYEDNFEYNPDHLWANPEGTYYQSGGKNWIYVYLMDDNGKIYCNKTDNGGGYVNTTIDFSGYIQIYNPEKMTFYTKKDGPDTKWQYNSIDLSKTILDPLVKRTYHYVFLVPDLVAEEEGARELIFTVCGEEYSFRF